MRSFCVIGNWKMRMSPPETERFIRTLLAELEEGPAYIGIAPPFTSISSAISAARGSRVAIGAQDVSLYSKGGYTGEISADLIEEMGVQFVIVGHSKRRSSFHEGEYVVRQKVERAFERGLTPLICIGETLQQKELGLTEEVLAKQIEGALEDATPERVRGVFFAYEPVWAIEGEGAADPEAVARIHGFCRRCLLKKWGEEVGERISILYGGSVTSKNVGELVRQPDVDGVLVGRASLDAGSFGEIIRRAEGTRR